MRIAALMRAAFALGLLAAFPVASRAQVPPSPPYLVPPITAGHCLAAGSNPTAQIVDSGVTCSGGGSVVITGGTINGTSIGATTPSTGAFTGLSSTNSYTSNVAPPATSAGVPAVLTQSISGNMGAPSSGYTVLPNTAALQINSSILGGWSKDTGDGNVALNPMALYIGMTTGASTLGPVSGIVEEVTLYGAKTGATDILGNPSVQFLTGQMNAGNAGVFLQGLGDIDLVDNGFDVAGYGLTLGLDRTVNTGALGAAWIGVHIASYGSKAIDAFFDAVGAGTVAFNASAASVTAGLAMQSGQGIYGNSVNSCGNARPTPACLSLGTDEISDTGPGWQFVVGGTGYINLDSSLVKFDEETQFVFSTTGASAQTFTNSPCSVTTTEQWIPVKINGQAHTFYLPACDAGF